jgi:hypothetical protein
LYDAASILCLQFVLLTETNAVKYVNAMGGRNPDSISSSLRPNGAHVVTGKSAIGVERDETINVITDRAIRRPLPLYLHQRNRPTFSRYASLGF